MEKKQRLIDVLSIASFVGKEDKLNQYITNYLNKNNIPNYSDKYGNIYATKGDAEYFPCVIAHTDTVHPIVNYTVYSEGDKLYALDENKKNTGIGGDDKCGVFACLELLLEVKNLKAAFFVCEEVGCIGSHLSDPDFFSNVGYAIQFDAPENNWISHYSDGIKLFNIDSIFFEKIEVVFKELMPNYRGKGALGKHPYTDVSALRKLYDFACINFSIGYYKMHTINEYILLNDVYQSINIGKSIINSLGEYNYFLPKEKFLITEQYKSILETTFLNWKSL